MAGRETPIQLTEDDVEYLLTVLRSSPQPLTLQKLIDALRLRASDRADGR